MQALFDMIWGVDYGSKLAGTTVIATLLNNEVTLHHSEKKKDADAFIRNLASEKEPTLIAIDAPLSLPGVYRHIEGCKNYHYRHADIQLNAMSPMFLGGLTARAMDLSAQLRAEGIQIIETYPKAQAQRIQIPDYKKKSADLMPQLHLLRKQTGWVIPNVQNQHQLDAVLALVGAYRFSKNTAEQVGLEQEGCIYF